MGDRGKLRTFDVDTVSGFLRHPEIYPAMADDYSDVGMVQQAAVSLISGGVWAVQPSESALFLYFPRTLTWWEVHTLVLPEGRGKKAIEDGKAGLRWVFNNSSCEKVVSLVPEFNRQALLYAKRVGLTVEGINRKSFRKDGHLYDQIQVGICKEDICQ